MAKKKEDNDKYNIIVELFNIIAYMTIIDDFNGIFGNVFSVVSCHALVQHTKEPHTGTILITTTSCMLREMKQIIKWRNYVMPGAEIRFQWFKVTLSESYNMSLASVTRMNV